MTPILLALGVKPLVPGGVDLRAGTDKYNSTSCTSTWWAEASPLYVLDASEHVWTFNRFTGVTIPKLASITAAYFDLTPSFLSGTPSGDLITVGIEQADNAPATTGYADIISRFNALPATVDWSPDSWAANTAQSTPDLKSQLQALVNRSGWASGNALVVITRSKTVGSVSIQAHSGPNNGGVPARIPRFQADYLAAP